VEDVGVWAAAELDVVGVGAAAEVGVGVWAACELADVGVWAAAEVGAGV